MFTIFTKPACPHCEATKRKFNKAGVEFKEVSLPDNPTELDYIKKQGYTMAPVIEDPYGHLHPYTETDELLQGPLVG